MVALEWEELFPDVRCFPINGAAVRTKRVLLKLGSPADVAKMLKMSTKRMTEIESGGQNVYAKTLEALADVLAVHWKELIDHPRLPKTPAPRTKDTNKVFSILINYHSIHEFDEEKIKKLVAILKEIVGAEGELTIDSVTGGSTQITIGMDEEDTIRLVSAFCQGKSDGIGFTDLKIHGNTKIFTILLENVLIKLVPISNFELPTSLHGLLEYDEFFPDKYLKRLKTVDYERKWRNRLLGRWIEHPKSNTHLPNPDERDRQSIEFYSKIIYAIIKNMTRELRLGISEDGVLTMTRIGVAEAGQHLGD